MSNDTNTTTTTKITLEELRNKLKGNRYITISSIPITQQLSRYTGVDITDKLTIEQLKLILDWYKQEGDGGFYNAHETIREVTKELWRLRKIASDTPPAKTETKILWEDLSCIYDSERGIRGGCHPENTTKLVRIDAGMSYDDFTTNELKLMLDYDEQEGYKGFVSSTARRDVVAAYNERLVVEAEIARAKELWSGPQCKQYYKYTPEEAALVLKYKEKCDCLPYQIEKMEAIVAAGAKETQGKVVGAAPETKAPIGVTETQSAPSIETQPSLASKPTLEDIKTIFDTERKAMRLGYCQPMTKIGCIKDEHFDDFTTEELKMLLDYDDFCSDHGKNAVTSAYKSRLEAASPELIQLPLEFTQDGKRKISIAKMDLDTVDALIKKLQNRRAELVPVPTNQNTPLDNLRNKLSDFTTAEIFQMVEGNIQYMSKVRPCAYGTDAELRTILAERIISDTTAKCCPNKDLQSPQDMSKDDIIWHLTKCKQEGCIFPHKVLREVRDNKVIAAENLWQNKLCNDYTVVEAKLVLEWLDRTQYKPVPSSMGIMEGIVAGKSPKATTTNVAIKVPTERAHPFPKSLDFVSTAPWCVPGAKLPYQSGGRSEIASNNSKGEDVTYRAYKDSDGVWRWDYQDAKEVIVEQAYEFDTKLWSDVKNPTPGGICGGANPDIRHPDNKSISFTRDGVPMYDSYETNLWHWGLGIDIPGDPYPVTVVRGTKEEAPKVATTSMHPESLPFSTGEYLATPGSLVNYAAGKGMSILPTKATYYDEDGKLRWDYQPSQYVETVIETEFTTPHHVAKPGTLAPLAAYAHPTNRYIGYSIDGVPLYRKNIAPHTRWRWSSAAKPYPEPKPTPEPEPAKMAAPQQPSLASPLVLTRREIADILTPVLPSGYFFDVDLDLCRWNTTWLPFMRWRKKVDCGYIGVHSDGSVTLGNFAWTGIPTDIRNIMQTTLSNQGVVVI